MRNRMDDKYKKEYERQKQKSQFHHQLENKWVEKQKTQWEHEKASLNKTKIKPKPDPATVEAELQLEEQLWAS